MPVTRRVCTKPRHGVPPQAARQVPNLAECGLCCHLWANGLLLVCGTVGGVLTAVHQGFNALFLSGGDWPVVAAMLFSLPFQTCPSDKHLYGDFWFGCFWISFLTATYSFSTATYSLLHSAFVCMAAHPCGVKSHGSAHLASVCMSSHQSARASWLTWLVRIDPCQSRGPHAYMHHYSCTHVSVLAMHLLCYSACLYWRTRTRSGIYTYIYSGV